MKIDAQVESDVRDAITVAVKGDLPSLEGKLGKIKDGHAAVELAVRLVYLLMVDAHSGSPTDEQVKAVAAEIARSEEWSLATEQEAGNFLLAVMNQRGAGLASLPGENVVMLSFVAAAHLLSSCRRDNEEWWEYLDRAEAALESQRS
jgi:hypothetical protein